MTQIIMRTVKFQLALSCADMTLLIIAWFSWGKFSIFYATGESMKLQVLSHLLNVKIINSERCWIRGRVGGKTAQQRRQWFGIWEMGIQTLALVFSLSWLISQAVQFSGFSFCNKEIITHTNLTGIWGLDISSMPQRYGNELDQKLLNAVIWRISRAHTAANQSILSSGLHTCEYFCNAWTRKRPQHGV